MKRLLTVALGVALCSYATAAHAARGHIWNSENVSDLFRDSNDYSRTPASRRSTATRRQRHAGGRSSRRSDAHRSSRRQASRRTSGRTAAHSGQRRTVAARSFTRYAAAGTSRGCLTPAARALLGRIEARFGSVQVVSTCRPGARIAGTGRISRHASGNAVDFNAPSGRKAEVVRWLVANHRSGGTMTYARMSHIHVDIGHRFVSLNSGGRY
jgi:uncharacterized protein YcbK (DUF882 family)